MIAFVQPVRYEADCKAPVTRRHKGDNFWDIKTRDREAEVSCPVRVHVSEKPQQATVDSQRIGANNVLVIFERLKQLLDEDDDLQLSQYAYSTAYSLLRGVIQAYDDVFPRAAVAVGEDEGIYIYWRKPDKSIELAIPSAPSGRHTIYVRDRGGSNLIDRVSIGELVNWLYAFAKP